MARRKTPLAIAALSFAPLIPCPACGEEVREEVSLRRSAEHAFWDKPNLALFTGIGGSRMFDYASTRHFRRRGLNEILLTNEIVDDKPLFIGIELAGTAASIGASAWLHRHGHHKLERWLSIAHIGITTFGAVRNFNLRAHPHDERARGSTRR
jgi:hypothetical protein